MKSILTLFLAIILFNLIGCSKDNNKSVVPTKNAHNISYIIDTNAKFNTAPVGTPEFIKYHPSTSYFQKDNIIKRDWYSIGDSKFRLDVNYPYSDINTDTSMNELGFYGALKPYTGIIIWMRIIHNDKDTIFYNSTP